MRRTIILTILDGWGIGERNQSNPIYLSFPQFINELKKEYFFGALSASGISVGLPWGEPGNCEAGHLSLGTGQIIYQDYPRISLAIQNGSFFKNTLLKDVINYCKKNKSTLHLIGLLSSGKTIACLNHLVALLKLAQLENFYDVFLDLFTDGIDSQESALFLIEKLEKIIDEQNLPGKISSLTGRFFALDSDSSLEIERSYQNLINGRKEERKPKDFLQENYKNNIPDQFIEPVSFGPTIKNNDGVLFFDFKQGIDEKLISHFARDKDKNLFLVTFIPSEKLGAEGAFPPKRITSYLSKVLSENNKIQIKITESLKATEVCSFFNGYKSEILPNEYRVIIPSSSFPYPQENPALKAEQITTKSILSLKEKAYDFILIDYPNPFIIGHSKDFKAALSVVKIIDEQIKKLAQAVEKEEATMIITSDHGCLEKCRDPQTGVLLTSNTANPVPFYLVDKRYRRHFSETEVRENENKIIGILCDIAPTILDLMGLKKTREMDGNSLLPLL